MTHTIRDHPALTPLIARSGGSLVQRVVFLISLNDFARSLACVGLCVSRRHYRCLGVNRSCFSFLRYLAARHKHRNYHHHFSNGVSDLEFAK